MMKVVCAIIINESKMLVTQIGSGSRAFEWEFPGGKIIPAESADAAVIREINEELTIEIKICEAMTSVIVNDSEKNFELIPFLCKINSGVIKLTEHIQMQWVNLETLDTIKLSAAYRKLIQQPDNQTILKKYAGKNVHNSC